MRDTISPFPSGWFHVADSRDVRSDRPTSLEYFGKKWVAFRTQEGARVFEARCPHLGSDLGKIGVVADGRIRCGFHGWTFDGGGACVSIPDCPRIPERARLAGPPIVERDGLVYMWHDTAGRAPFFEPPELDELGAPGWSKPQRHEARVPSRVHFFTENIFDTTHFEHVHGSKGPPVTETRVDGPIARFQIRGPVWKSPLAAISDVVADIEVAACGPGVALTRFRSPLVGLVFASYTPVDDSTVHSRFHVAVKSSIPGLRGVLARGFLRFVVAQSRADYEIFRNRAAHDSRSPVLCATDDWVTTFRSWFDQFEPPLASGGA